MIKYLEAKLTEPQKKTPNTDNQAVTEQANVYETVTAEAKARNDTEIDLKE